MHHEEAKEFALHVLRLMPWQFDDNKGGCLKQFALQWDVEAEKLLRHQCPACFGDPDRHGCSRCDNRGTILPGE